MWTRSNPATRYFPRQLEEFERAERTSGVPLFKRLDRYTQPHSHSSENFVMPSHTYEWHFVLYTGVHVQFVAKYARRDLLIQLNKLPCVYLKRIRSIRVEGILSCSHLINMFFPLILWQTLLMKACYCGKEKSDNVRVLLQLFWILTFLPLFLFLSTSYRLSFSHIIETWKRTLRST